MLSIDSAEVIHGMFKMEGITDSTSMASLYMDDESIMPFVIEKGKKYAIIGDSGSGKSTLIKALLGAVEITQGNIYINDYDIKDISREQIYKWFSIVTQNPMCLNASIRKNVDITGRFSDEEIWRALETAELKDEIKNMPLGLDTIAGEGGQNISGGQRQRIGIARALSVNPEFLLCDEPISALDVSIRAQVLNLLNSMKKSRGLTYLFIAHDLSVVKHISNRSGVMYLGKMVELADSFELIAHSVHPYTRSLISAIPVADPVMARQSHRIVLQGDVPSPLNPPSGCRFRTRCPYADERCAAEVPEFKEVSSGHWAACHHLDKVK